MPAQRASVPEQMNYPLRLLHLLAAASCWAISPASRVAGRRWSAAAVGQGSGGQGRERLA